MLLTFRNTLLSLLVSTRRALDRSFPVALVSACRDLDRRMHLPLILRSSPLSLLVSARGALNRWDRLHARGALDRPYDRGTGVSARRSGLPKMPSIDPSARTPVSLGIDTRSPGPTNARGCGDGA